MYFFPHDEKYEVSDQFIIIDKLKIPYQIVGNNVEFQKWESSSQEDTITWEIELDDNVEELIEQSKKFKEETEANLNN